MILETTLIRRLIYRELFRIAQSGIESALLKKVDGYAVAGSPEGRDWHVDCDSQKQMCWSLHEILVLLKIIT